MNIFELDTFIEYIQVPLYDNPSIYNIDKKLNDLIEIFEEQRIKKENKAEKESTE